MRVPILIAAFLLFTTACSGVVSPTVDTPVAIAITTKEATGLPHEKMRGDLPATRHSPPGVVSSSTYKKKRVDASLAEELMLADRLLNTSSAARQVKASHNRQALEKYREAKRFLDLARNSDSDHGKRLLFQARQLFFGALKRVSSQNKNSLSRQYHALHQSTQALLAAYTRVATEKSLPQAVDKENEISEILAKADAQYESGNSDVALDIVRQAFHKVRPALIALREGSTLVRSLNFATPHEEYDYELGRYKSHRMMMDLLTQNKNIDQESRQRIKQSLASAETLFQSAQDEADKGQYKMAIHSLENATKMLLRAIRQAGIYIPG